MSNYLIIMLILNALLWPLVIWQKYRLKQNKLKLDKLRKESCNEGK